MNDIVYVVLFMEVVLLVVEMRIHFFLLFPFHIKHFFEKEKNSYEKYCYNCFG